MRYRAKISSLVFVLWLASAAACDEYEKWTIGRHSAQAILLSADEEFASLGIKGRTEPHRMPIKGFSNQYLRRIESWKKHDTELRRIYGESRKMVDKSGLEASGAILKVGAKKKSVDCMILYGVFLAKDGQYKEAISQFSKAVTAAQLRAKFLAAAAFQVTAATNNKLVAQMFAGQTRAAVKTLEKIAKRTSFSPEMQHNVGLALQTLSKSTALKTQIEKLSSKMPQCNPNGKSPWIYMHESEAFNLPDEGLNGFEDRSCLVCGGHRVVNCREGNCHGGTQKVRQSKVVSLGRAKVLDEKVVSIRCQACHGTGKIKCTKCNGQGIDPRFGAPAPQLNGFPARQRGFVQPGIGR